MGKNPYAGQALDRLIEADSGLTTDHLNMLASVTAGTATANKALVLGASKEIATITTATITNATITTATVTTANLTTAIVAALTYATASRTATADGLTTGTIAAAGMIQFVTVTSADANHIIVLPAPTPGTIVILSNGATGYELRTSAPATIAINGGAGANAESAIAASSMVIAVCTTATTWQAITIAATTLAAVEAAA